ncbi:hypothetical protein DdX_17415 [Ditylenchus destructor]|uniref:Uncharacterized protein n=1 Tax=Ditylenchus destructor TaxID=166010 RepID=A0AAD4QVT7_9BILA|nr:hypothetical protein DdX_17415 [Ditylenchus destructor]
MIELLARDTIYDQTNRLPISQPGGSFEVNSVEETAAATEMCQEWTANKKFLCVLYDLLKELVCGALKRLLGKGEGREVMCLAGYFPLPFFARLWGASADLQRETRGNVGGEENEEGKQTGRDRGSHIAWENYFFSIPKLRASLFKFLCSGTLSMELSAECYLASSLKEPTYHIHSSWLRTAYKATKFSPSGTTNNTKRCPQPTSSV